MIDKNFQGTAGSSREFRLLIAFVVGVPMAATLHSLTVSGSLFTYPENTLDRLSKSKTPQTNVTVRIDPEPSAPPLGQIASSQNTPRYPQAASPGATPTQPSDETIIGQPQIVPVLQQAQQFIIAIPVESEGADIVSGTSQPSNEQPASGRFSLDQRVDTPPAEEEPVPRH